MTGKTVDEVLAFYERQMAAAVEPAKRKRMERAARIQRRRYSMLDCWYSLVKPAIAGCILAVIILLAMQGVWSLFTKP